MSDTPIEQIPAETYAAKFIEFIGNTMALNDASITDNKWYMTKETRRFGVMDMLSGMNQEQVDGMKIYRLATMIEEFDGNPFVVSRIVDQKLASYIKTQGMDVRCTQFEYRKTTEGQSITFIIILEK